MKSADFVLAKPTVPLSSEATLRALIEKHTRGEMLTPVELAIVRAPESARTMKAQIEGWERDALEGSELVRDAKRRKAYLERLSTAVDRFTAFVTTPAKMERPTASVWQRALNAARGGNAVGSDVEKFLACRPEAAMPFVVEHDWSAAIKHAENFEDGEYEYPYDAVVFEFCFSGHPVLLAHIDGQRFSLVRLGDIWLISSLDDLDTYARQKDEERFDLNDVSEVMDRQIRAVCIALDADVAIAEQIREPSNGRDPVTREPLPPHSYHVVRLANRRRALPLTADDDHNGTRHRLHFVRGHWRHYETRKTWIKWHLRGDPDLGFIDKHYRL